MAQDFNTVTPKEDVSGFSSDFIGAFNGAHGSIDGRLGLGLMHRLTPDFDLPPKYAFNNQRRQLSDIYEELLDYDKTQTVGEGVKIFFIPPTHLIEYTDNKEEEPDKHPRPLVETFLHDFSGTTVHGLVYLAGISDRWELALTLGEWGTRKNTTDTSKPEPKKQRSEPTPASIPEPLALQQTVEALPKSLRERAVDMFPLAYVACGGIFDRKVGMTTPLAHIPKQSNDPRLLQPRLLTANEIEMNLAIIGDTSSLNDIGRIIFGHYVQMGDRRSGSSFGEAEIIVDGKRPRFPDPPAIHIPGLQLTNRRGRPFTLKRRPVFVSRAGD